MSLTFLRIVDKDISHFNPKSLFAQSLLTSQSSADEQFTILSLIDVAFQKAKIAF